jgi:hypothetical protein
MQFILYFMLFTTPPAVKGQEMWSLQTASAMDFNTEAACHVAAETLIKAVKKTDTVRLYGWCFPKGHDGLKPLAAPKEVESRTGVSTFKSY